MIPKIINQPKIESWRNSILILFIGFSINILSQTTLTKDSFFLKQKTFPENYVTLIADSEWRFIGVYTNIYKNIYAPDSIVITKIKLFDNGKEYRKIKGNKIITNSDFAIEKIIYIDNRTLILESKEKNIIRRVLYRRVI